MAEITKQEKSFNANEKLKELRIKTGFSQNQFSEYFGLPLRCIQGWEQNRMKAKPYLVQLLYRIWYLEHEMNETKPVK